MSRGSCGKLPPMSEATYRTLEASVIDLVRVGVSGNGAGVRQLANRILRAAPSECPEQEEFRSRLAEALVAASGSPPFRSAAAPAAAVGGDVIRWSRPIAAELPQIVLSGASEEAAEGLLRQWMHVDRLAAAGLAPANAVLLKGPSGVGKTLLAQHIAARLNLPLARVDLAEVMSSLLGGTGRNLRDAMWAALEAPCVLLMDEFDAVAKRRDDTSDIGELKRIVNVMLLELDQWPADRLLVAATNHPHLVDPAVARRFETVIELGMPPIEARARQFRLLLAGEHLSGWVEPLLAELTAGRSQADIARCVRVARRESLMDEVPLERTMVASAASGSLPSAVRDEAMARLKTDWRLSNREIARIFGVSHPTVANALRRANGKAER